MKTAIVLTHAEFEGPSRIGELLARRGYALDVRSLFRGDDVPRALPRETPLVVMGGSMGVADVGGTEYPFLERERDLLRRCIDEDAPVLGVCLGAQLLAHAAGARVVPMRDGRGERVYEVGWGSVTLRDAGRGALAGLPGELPVLHWHGDAFDVPPAAVALASSALCAGQAFRLRQRLFGLQFHCEASAADVETFLREDADFARKARGPDAVAIIRRETTESAGSAALRDRLLENVLDALLTLE